MTRLRIASNATQTAFDANQAPITIGRGRDNDVRIEDPSVSRTHLELRHDGAWVAADTSSRGTWLAGERIADLRITGITTVHLGSPDGPAITLEPIEAEDETRTVAVRSATETVSLDGAELRLAVDGADHIFSPEGKVTVGRDPSNTVVLGSSHALVSRHHLTFTWTGHGWTMEDAGSSRGTFLDGRRLSDARPATGAFTLHLGDPDAGTELRVITAGVHRKRRPMGQIAIAALALIAVLVAATALLTGGGDNGDSTANSPSELAAARQATVLVELLDADLQRIGLKGSGVLIDSTEGLVLTNAHVAYPQTHGERTQSFSPLADPPLFAIGFAIEDGGEVERYFVAEPVAIHPFHDAALLRIVADGNNEPVDGVPYDALPIGSSADLLAGDLIDQLGYPAVASTLRVSVTTRNVQSFAPCQVNPNDDCLADLDDGWLNLSGQPLGGGSSGGPIVRNGEIVGLNQGAVFQDDRPVEQNRAVPIDLVVAELLRG